jgi:hypothetical protein
MPIRADPRFSGHETPYTLHPTPYTKIALILIIGTSNNVYLTFHIITGVIETIH